MTDAENKVVFRNEVLSRGSSLGEHTVRRGRREWVKPVRVAVVTVHLRSRGRARVLFAAYPSHYIAHRETALRV